MNKYTYKVIVADNYHYQDEESEYEGGTYTNCKEAKEACQEIVNASLHIIDNIEELSLSERQKLFEQYATFGEDPFIVTDDPRCSFSAWSYVRSLCKLPEQ